jgi:hypothetical protein
MNLILDAPEAERLAAELVRRTGLPLADAVTQALREQVARLAAAPAPEAADVRETLQALLVHADAHAAADPASARPLRWEELKAEMEHDFG